MKKVIFWLLFIIAVACAWEEDYDECSIGFKFNNKHCGEYGKECNGGKSCIDGHCLCLNSHDCNGECVNTKYDVNNCGQCNNKCLTPANGQAVCISGACGVSCKPGYTNCNNTCAYIESDPNNCGVCANTCPASTNSQATCVSGNCGVSCNNGFSNCNGICVNENTDINNCGACGNTCPVSANGQATCSSGNCGISCNSGYTNCNAVCVNKKTDVNDCGACGNTCPAPTDGQATCVSGKCGIICDTGFTDCNGVCINKQTDSNNCGGCGNTCPNGQTCVNGGCSYIPGTIYFDDLSDGSSVTNGYHYLNWDNIYITAGADSLGGGYDHGTVSPPNVAFNGYGTLGTISGTAPFDPISVYATAAWNNGLVATFTGLLSGNTVGTVVVTLETTAPLFVNLTPLGTIDTLTFIGTGGTNCGCGGGDSGDHIALDNLTIL